MHLGMKVPKDNKCALNLSILHCLGVTTELIDAECNALLEGNIGLFVYFAAY